MRECARACACVRANVHACACMRVRACARARLRLCARACARVRARACLVQEDQDRGVLEIRNSRSYRNASEVFFRSILQYARACARVRARAFCRRTRTVAGCRRATVACRGGGGGGGGGGGAGHWCRTDVAVWGRGRCERARGEIFFVQRVSVCARALMCYLSPPPLSLSLSLPLSLSLSLSLSPLSLSSLSLCSDRGACSCTSWTSSTMMRPSGSTCGLTPDSGRQGHG